MLNYKKFLLEKLSDKVLEYYMFDWDDNVLIMPTVVHVEHLEDNKWVNKSISTSEFANIRTLIKKKSDKEQTGWRLKNDDYDQTFSEFRDFGERGESAFIKDSIQAIETNSFGPVWNKFIKCIVDGNIFMIITARGHEPSTMRYVINWIIYNYLNIKQKKKLEKNLRKFNYLFGLDDSSFNFHDLINDYLDKCDFIGIYSNYFKKKFGIEGRSTTAEQYKSMAVKYFTEKINKFGIRSGRRVKVGFSDDDSITVQHVYKYMKDKLSLDFPIDYHVYHTKDGDVKEL